MLVTERKIKQKIDFEPKDRFWTQAPIEIPFLFMWQPAMLLGAALIDPKLSPSLVSLLRFPLYFCWRLFADIIFVPEHVILILS